MAILLRDTNENCVECGAELPSRLETYGDLDAPMCFGCHLQAQDHPLSLPLFSYEDAGNGWFYKCLTSFGAIYLGGGKEGDRLMLVRRGQ